jgi:hypothetical protein
MKTYLSIDIDYWNLGTSRDLDRELNSLLRLANNIPIIAVMNHQQLLPIINTSGANHLVNIDEHSDLTACDVNELECGTWVSYVTWRRTGTYLWIRSQKGTAYGSCNGEDNSWNKGNDWKKAESKYINPDNLRLVKYLSNCVGIGICMSPNYANYDLMDIFRKVIKQYNIPYKKGVMRENNKRKIRPPVSSYISG